MSLNHLMKITSMLPLHTKQFKTEHLTIKLGDGSYMPFILPSKGVNRQVLQSNGDGSFEWVDNHDISSIYCVPNDINSVFNDVLDISNKFSLIRSGNYVLHQSIEKKVLLKIHMNYKWSGSDICPDFMFKVYINNNEIYSNKEGLSDYPNVWNKLSDSIVLDLDANDVIHLKLFKSDLLPNSFTIQKNSFYSIELL